MNNDVFRVLNSKNSVSSDLLSMLRSRQKSMTDIIDMDDPLQEKLIRTFFEIDDETKCVSENVVIPNDIFIADTIPLKSFVISGQYEDTRGYGSHYEYKFTIFDKDRQIPTRYKIMDKNGMVDPHSMQILDLESVDISGHLQRGDSELIVGTVKITEDIYLKHSDRYSHRSGYITYSFPLMLYKDTLSIPSIIYDLKLNDEIRHTTKSVYIDGENDVVDLGTTYVGSDASVHFLRELRQAISTLYAVECFLLNPVVMDVFKRNSKPTPVDVNKNSKSSKKQKIKYVKRHIINADEIDRAFEKLGFVRKAMIWYVTGHWREYKSGKRIFVQGYWKGALRNARNSAFPNLEPREREIVTDERS